VDIGNLDAFEALRAVLSRTFDECLHDVYRACLSVLGDPASAQQVAGFEQRIERLDLLGGDHVHPGYAEGVVHGGDAFELLEAGRAVGDAEAAHLAKAGGLSRFSFQLRKYGHGVLAEFCVAFVGAHGADESRGVPAGPAGELFSLQQNHIVPAELGEVVGDAGAGDATADNDRAGLFRYGIAHGLWIS
jgi:hypothetical protein